MIPVGSVSLYRMYCPRCKDEFRSGFTRCASCGVDLVASRPSDAALPPEAVAESSPVSVRLADYCGFMSIDEARSDRDRLREAGIGTDIVIREAPESHPDKPIVEEFWLRVDTRLIGQAVNVLGYDAADESHCNAVDVPDSDHVEEEFDCGDCGHTVSESESSCPKCGARFDDA